MKDTGNDKMPVPCSMFENKVFVLVESGSFCGEALDQCSTQLTERGGQVMTFNELAKKACDAIVVADSIHFDGYEDREDAMLCVVHPSWVDDSIQFGRPLPPSRYTPDPKYFMSKISICVVGMTQGDQAAICAGVVAAGGLFSESINRITTHVISVNMKDPVCQEAAKHKIKVAIPHWIDACLKLQRLVDDTPFLLPNAPILDTNSHNFLESGKEMDKWEYQSPQHVSREQGAMTAEGTHSTVLMHKKFFLGSDLALESMLSTVVDVIDNSGGRVVDSIQDADVYLGQYRTSPEFKEAAKRKCTIGNLTWLYYMITHHAWVSPLQRLLHYPIVEGGIPQMQDMVISLTNYSGEGRQFLAKLITACGAKFTRNLTQRNTHLIAAYCQGDKCDAARYWNLHIVNHLWLEESYALWQVQSVTCPKYTYFPARLNMSGIVGKTLLDHRVLRRWFTDSGDVAAGADPGTPADHHTAQRKVVQDSMASNVTPTRRMGSSRPKRTARDKASVAVHDAMEKENEFQKQFRNRDIPLLPEEIAAKRRRLEPSAATPEPASKNDESLSPSSAATPTANHRGASLSTSPQLTTSPAPKQTKEIPNQQETTPKKFNFVTTGLEDFNHTTAELSKVGLASVARADRAQLLVAERVFRSEKFLKAMHTALHIVKPSYIEACLKAGYLVYPIPPEHFVSEEIEAALRRRKQQPNHTTKAKKGGLFDGYFFNLKPNLRSSPEVVKGIISEHGGKCQVLRGTGKLKPSPALDKGKSIVLYSEAKDIADDEPDVIFKSLDWLFDCILSMDVAL